MGINIEYLKREGANKTVVFIHGWMDSLRDFDESFYVISKKYNVIRFDLPGHGSSPTIKEYSIQNYSKPIEELIASIPGEFVFVGHSFGSLIASDIYKRHSKNSSKLIVLNPPMGEMPFALGLLKIVIVAFTKLRLQKLIIKTLKNNNIFQKYWATTFVGKESNITHQARKDSIQGIKEVDIEAVNQGIVDILDNKMILNFNDIDKNCYLIEGAADPLLEENVISKVFKKDNTYIIKDGGHALNRTMSDLFNKILLDVIESPIV